MELFTDILGDKIHHKYNSPQIHFIQKPVSSQADDENPIQANQGMLVKTLYGQDIQDYQSHTAQSQFGFIAEQDNQQSDSSSQSAVSHQNSFIVSQLQPHLEDELSNFSSLSSSDSNLQDISSHQHQKITEEELLRSGINFDLKMQLQCRVSYQEDQIQNQQGSAKITELPDIQAINQLSEVQERQQDQQMEQIRRNEEQKYSQDYKIDPMQIAQSNDFSEALSQAQKTMKFNLSFKKLGQQSSQKFLPFTHPFCKIR